MNLIPIGRTRPDQTECYAVELEHGHTVRDFVQSILTQCPKDWGIVRIFPAGTTPAPAFRYEYKYGKARPNTDALPDEVLDAEVASVDAAGGWSRMDYDVRLKGPDDPGDQGGDPS